MDLDWLTPELAIGACFDSCHVHDLATTERIAAVIDVRDEACDDEVLLRRHGVALLHLPTPDHSAITPAMLDEGVTFASRFLCARQRVLVHCVHGIGRSALLALCVLVDRGHPPLAALELAKSRRERVSPSPPQFEAWAAWLRSRGHRPPPFHAFAAIAYRHLKAV